MLSRLNLIYSRSDIMYFDFTQLINNTNTIITQNNQILNCLWITFCLMLCAFVLILFRSVKK